MKCGECSVILDTLFMLAYSPRLPPVPQNGISKWRHAGMKTSTMEVSVDLVDEFHIASVGIKQAAVSAFFNEELPGCSECLKRIVLAMLCPVLLNFPDELFLLFPLHTASLVKRGVHSIDGCSDHNT